MPYRKIFFEKYKPFHIISRAVEERKIFATEDDCYRLIFQLYAANVGKPSFNLWRKDIIKAAKALLEGEDISPKFIIKKHQPLVLILDFSLVMNHYHLFLLPNIENSVPLYIQKLNRGFAGYFNLKYNRKGSLFGGPYKSIPIEGEYQAAAVSRYVSIINPLDVFQPGWRQEGLKDWRKAVEFLGNYPFSSFPDKGGERKSKILAPKEILKQYSFIRFNREEFKEFTEEFLKEKQASIKPFYLE